MATAPWTAVHNTPNKSIRQDVARRGCVLHHAAMTNLAGLRRLEMGAKQVSSSAIIKDTNIEKMMPDEAYRAWSLSSAYWDSALRSIEGCNESTSGWTISDETHWAMAKSVAYWSEVEGWWPHRSGPRSTWTVITHGEVYTIHGASYATACAGGTDADLVTVRAQGIRGGSITAPAGTSSSIAAVSTTAASVSAEVDYAYGLTAAAQLAIQQALTRMQRYSGLEDGIFGELSVGSFQQWLKDAGYLNSGYVVDGKPGAVYGEALHVLADKYGYTGTHVGLPGDNVSAALATWAASMAPSAPAPVSEVSGPVVGPVIRSGADWAIRLPQGALAKRIGRELIKKGRLPQNYNNDGDPQRVFEAAVQETLNFSNTFHGPNDGKLERGGAYGVQDYAIKFGNYTARGGARDGRPEGFSWQCFADGLPS